MPMKMNNGTATSWSSSMVEFTCSVIRKKVTATAAPQEPKVKARKISVKEIGNPTKIENSIARQHEQADGWFVEIRNRRQMRP